MEPIRSGIQLRNVSWYSGNTTYDTVLAVAFGLVAFVVLAAPFVQSPYGRFASKRFGVNLDPRLGWFLMELPATVSFLYFFFAQGERRSEVVSIIFLMIWLVHYGNRGFAFPLLMRVPKGQTSSFSITVVVMGWVVTSLHGYLNAAFITSHGEHFTIEWLTDPRFLVGLAIYYTGYSLNIHSDWIVRRLRTKEEVASGEKVYRIPKGGLFTYVTNPSYFTELVAWSGFAICTWSLGGVFILAISAANLIPRAFATHKWYLEKFEDYPKNRKALIPFVI